MQQTFISQQELQKVNPELRARYGTLCQIAYGTCVNYQKGKKRYYIVLNDKVSTYKSLTMLYAIGKRVKEVLGATEVICSGIKIA